LAWQRDGAPFGYGHAKLLLAEKIETHFEKARERFTHLSAHPDEVDALLERGAARAREVARATIDECRIACGLR
jgi:tryptophanyl-tRNA synthetase